MQIRRPRDPRLDFFRGLAMLIIFVAHVPANSWTLFIPARFGFSSAAEMFVFCSGYASALAFGAIFIQRGWRAGTVRILRRIWQLYWAHLGLFLSLVLVALAAAYFGIGARGAVADLNLRAFAGDRWSTIARLMTLSYVPDLLNILPMYVVLLALVPLAMALAKITPWLVVAASVGLWGLVQTTGLNLPSGIAPGRAWFFDPFAWQLMFFTGFAFASGWLPRPRLNQPVLLSISVAVVIFSVPINFWAFTDHVPQLLAIRDWLTPDGIVATTRLDALRYVHFLCLAYVALSLADRWPCAFGSSALAWVLLIGRQALPAFLSSVVAGCIAGTVLDVAGRGPLAAAAVNLTGFGVIFCVARAAVWLKLAKAGEAPPRHWTKLGLALLAQAGNAAKIRTLSRQRPADA
jgi:hypothetical protein